MTNSLVNKLQVETVISNLTTEPDTGENFGTPRVLKKFMFDQVFVPEFENQPQKKFSHTQEDLRLAQQAAEQEGYQRGLAEAQQGLLFQAGQRLYQCLQDFQQNQRHQEKILHQEVARLSQEILKTLMPAYLKCNASAEIFQVIETAFSTAESQKINVYVHPNQVESLTQFLKDFTQDNADKMSVIIQTVSSIDHFDLSDCRIEWQGGGLERRESRLKEEIELALTRLAAWDPPQTLLDENVIMDPTPLNMTAGV